MHDSEIYKRVLVTLDYLTDFLKDEGFSRDTCFWQDKNNKHIVVFYDGLLWEGLESLGEYLMDQETYEDFRNDDICTDEDEKEWIMQKIGLYKRVLSALDHFNDFLEDFTRSCEDNYWEDIDGNIVEIEDGNFWNGLKAFKGYLLDRLCEDDPE